MEIELKAYADDLSVVEKQLKKRHARLKFKGVQNADYYSPNEWKNETTGFVLRIRTEKRKGFLTLKKASATDGAWVEHETPVGDVEETRKILFEAGFQKFLSVNKHRTEYVLGDVSYCLDDVQGLGKFVEVEKIGEDAEKIQSELKEKLNALGLTRITQNGYVKLLKEKHLGGGML